MPERIRVLHVEDNPDHALLIRRSLEREDPSLEITTAASAEEALALMEKDGFQVILSDYALGPGMSGLDLLKAVREKGADVPFVILTGQGNEEVASEALRMGANDYIIKRSGALQFKRVALTIRNQWEALQARLQKEEAEARYRHLVENVNAGIALARGDRFVYVNPKLCEIMGYSAEELTSRPFLDFVAPASRETVAERYRRRQAGEEMPPTYDIWVFHKDGREICLELTASVIRDSEGISTLAVLREVTRERETEERAQRMEETLDLVFRQAGEAIFIHDLEGRIIEANPAASLLTGYSHEELCSMRVQDLHVPEERDLSESKLAAARLDGLFGFVGTGRCKDGTTKRCAVTTSMVRIGDRSLILSLVKEVPERMTAHEEEWVAAAAEERLKAALGQVPMVAVQGYDREGRVTYWNRASEELYGFRREEALGKTLDQLILDQAAWEGFLEELREVWESAVPAPGREWLTRDREGNQHWVYSTIIPVLQGGECVEVFCMDLDITARKELEAELQARNAELEAFAQIMSHDLRAPLTSIDGFARLAKEAAEGKFGPLEMEYLDRIIKASENMEKMINAMLDMARIGIQSTRSGEVDLRRMVEDIWGELRVDAQRPGARLRFSLQVERVTCIPVLLRQVLVNLVDNALKYNTRSSTPLVEVGSSRREGETLVYVRDDGPGIPSGFEESIFEPFKRLDSTPPGSGIGLSAVRRIVFSWGGEIWVESEPGAGSTFYFTIPE